MDSRFSATRNAKRVERNDKMSAEVQNIAVDEKRPAVFAAMDSLLELVIAVEGTVAVTHKKLEAWFRPPGGEAGKKAEEAKSDKCAPFASEVQAVTRRLREALDAYECLIMRIDLPGSPRGTDLDNENLGRPDDALGTGVEQALRALKYQSCRAISLQEYMSSVLWFVSRTGAEAEESKVTPRTEPTSARGWLEDSVEDLKTALNTHSRLMDMVEI